MSTGPALVAEKVMFLRIAALAGGAVSNLLLHREAPGATEDEIKGYLAQPSIVDEVFARFDTNREGVVTFNGIFGRSETPGDTLGAELSRFLRALEQELALGTGNEHVFSLPGIRRSALPQHYCSEGDEHDDDDNPRPCQIFPDPEAQRH